MVLDVDVLLLFGVTLEGWDDVAARRGVTGDRWGSIFSPGYILLEVGSVYEELEE